MDFPSGQTIQDVSQNILSENEPAENPMQQKQSTEQTNACQTIQDPSQNILSENEAAANPMQEKQLTGQTNNAFELAGGDFSGAHVGPHTYNLTRQGVVGGNFQGANFGPQQIVHNTYHVTQAATEKEQTESSKAPEEGDRDFAQLSDTIRICKAKPLCKQGSVYYGEQTSDVYGAREIAVKLISYNEQNAKEAKTLLKLSSHPNVVRIIHSATCCQSLYMYIAMELCQTQNLHDYIISNKHAAFDEKKAISWARQVTKAINHIHKNRILHRDLKPHNILISVGLNKLKISDFGLSKELRSGRSVTVQSSRRVGTDGYRAPETYNRDVISQQADIFSLGLVVFFIWSDGSHPYGDDPDDWNGNIKRDRNQNLLGVLLPNAETGRTLLSWMLQFEPKARPTAEQALDHKVFTTKENEHGNERALQRRVQQQEGGMQNLKSKNKRRQDEEIVDLNPKISKQKETNLKPTESTALLGRLEPSITPSDVVLESESPPGTWPKVGDHVVSMWGASIWQYFTATIVSFDSTSLKYTIDWDDPDPTGRVVDYYNLALDKVPAEDQVGVGSKVLFPQGCYRQKNAPGRNYSHGWRWHQGEITRIDRAKDGVKRYEGRHTKGKNDGKYVHYNGYSEVFSGYKIEDFRMPPIVFDIHSSPTSIPQSNVTQPLCVSQQHDIPNQLAVLHPTGGVPQGYRTAQTPFPATATGLLTGPATAVTVSALVGFNTFMPPGYKIEVSGNDLASVTGPNMLPQTINTHGGAGATTIQVHTPQTKYVTPPGQAFQYQQPTLIVSQAGQAVNTLSSVYAPGAHSIQSMSLSASSAGSSLPVMTLSSINRPKQEVMPWNQAANYVNKIKHRYRRQTDVYKAFLEILHKYSKEPRMVKETNGAYTPTLSESEVYAQVAKLLKNDEDLLREFEQFLPNAGGGMGGGGNLSALTGGATAAKPDSLSSEHVQSLKKPSQQHSSSTSSSGPMSSITS